MSQSLRGQRTRLLFGATLLFGVLASPALASVPAGSDPPANFAPRPLPSACRTAPTSATCVNAGVYYLDRGRARLNQPAYKLPANFPALAPDQQALILTNLDRILYRLPPIPGVAAGLDSDSYVGMRDLADPSPSVPILFNYTSNWGGGQPNFTIAYETWMYDDGRGSPNADCTATSLDLCWGHRHTVLQRFVGYGPMAMGAAAGRDRYGTRAFAMLLGIGIPSYRPNYTYTWKQAMADGAGSNVYTVKAPKIARHHKRRRR